ncbi:MAG: hypothetical protein Q7J56_01150 [Deltaproteobacteria bacterium]|nr:hypothetical protein [Deltaproteobacteria bacterium]
MRTKNPQTFRALVSCALLLTISLLGLASPAWSNYDQLRDEIAQFHAFMRKHPKVSTDLQANPQLVNNRKYLDKHEEVRKFLRQHPAVQQEIAQHPRRVFGRYYIDDRREYSDNRPEHRWDYRYNERRNDWEHRDHRDRR